MKSIILSLIFLATACQKDSPVNTQECESYAENVASATNFVQGKWKISEIWAGRSGKQPVTKTVELNFVGNKVDVTEDGKTITVQYEIIKETNSQMLRMSQLSILSFYDPRYVYFSGYLRVCQSKLTVGMMPVDGTDYVYTKVG